MNTLPITIQLTDEGRVARGDMVYACARNQAQAHNLLIRVVKNSGVSQKELARRTGIDEATISRTLSRPRNSELNTLSKLVYGACGMMLSFSLFSPQKARAERIYLATEIADAQSTAAGKLFVYENMGKHTVSSAGEAFENLFAVKTNDTRVTEKCNA